ncbi:LEAF RUST 10 DISEASE-RESISTANCE LOCUS RECEPTOR-LIKE PROTEIN KINASE-like 2.4 [Gastrolobium bilobum]|uniref:LEAF RUST 10 DISEASE-RESISTANCE LOCUS RECEPTOR-LIKE PROTEIN KINASE-like 2.4 n=1 Tax=Gastrolobium bilobum TaxID=150636 RepID=UPI002AB32390|nr:LEAF RUST 10 DISEASE-RESISTANCE LOCUS RECEPTOR-LIKE PROTEIN KINASE-like 2.4 [Gastrolobium bilobum]
MKPLLLLHQSSIFILLLTFIISFNIPTSLGANDDSKYTNCTKTFNCGDTIPANLRYPFWGGERPQYCGEPHYELTCDNIVPKITINYVTYRILALDLASQNLTLARDVFWNDTDSPSTSCSNDYMNNSTFDPSVFIKYDDEVVEVSLLYDCNTVPPSSGVVRTCLDETLYYAPQFAYLGVCKMIIVPVSDAIAAYDPSSIQILLDEGFRLQWIENNNYECDTCLSSQGECGNDEGEFKCFCKDGPHKTSCSDSGKASGKSKWSNLAVGLGASIAGVVTCIGFISIVEKRRKFLDHNVEDFLESHDFLAPKRYSYSEVKRITNSFRDKLGQGGYGVVYKASLPDGRHVAVKVISESKGNGEEFINEVASISRTSHVNIVSLLGFCSEMNKRALIYELMPNGSLDKFIYKSDSPNAICNLDWNTLHQIAIGIARGLEYLHRGCSARILHLDIKPQNILLDEDFCPKISDFGLAKLCQKKDSIVPLSGTRGTIGYIAPEVFSRLYGGVSHKSDVYSYGMLVIEMIGGRKNYESGGSQASEMYFPDWIYKDLEQGNIPASCLAISEEEKDMVRKITLVSLWCIQPYPSNRPSMSKVVEMLEGPLDLVPFPPKPGLISPQRPPLQISDISSGTNSMTTSKDGFIESNVSS